MSFLYLVDYIKTNKNKLNIEKINASEYIISLTSIPKNN
jgi:hypothetical protein